MPTADELTRIVLGLQDHYYRPVSVLLEGKILHLNGDMHEPSHFAVQYPCGQIAYGRLLALFPEGSTAAQLREAWGLYWHPEDAPVEIRNGGLWAAGRFIC